MFTNFTDFPRDYHVMNKRPDELNAKIVKCIFSSDNIFFIKYLRATLSQLNFKKFYFYLPTSNALVKRIQSMTCKHENKIILVSCQLRFR